MNCPLCNSITNFETSVGFYVCSKCREMLSDSELVSRASRSSKRQYLKANYPGVPKSALKAIGY